MIHLFSRTAAIAMLGLSLAGCAGERQSRVLSGQTAAVLNDYRRHMDNFAASQTGLNKSNDDRVFAMNGASARARAYSDIRLTGLKTAGDAKALGLYQGYAGRSIDDIIKSSAVLGSLTPPPASTTVSFDGTAVNGVVKQLKALEQSPDAAARIKALLGYRQELQDAYKASLDKAADDTGKSDDKAKDLDTNVSKATPDPAP